MRLEASVLMGVVTVLFTGCSQFSGLAAADHSSQKPHTHNLSTTPGVKQPSMLVVDERQEGRLTIRIGPMHFPARTAHWYVNGLVFSIPFDGWLTAFEPNLIDRRGQRLPGELLHHVNFHNTTRRDLLCPKDAEFVFSAGRELQPWRSPVGTGLRVHQDDPILVRMMLGNQTDLDFPNAYFEMRITYTPYSELSHLQNVHPILFAILHCKKGPTFYDLKPGLNVATKDIVIPLAGKLLMLGGHMHDYARSLTLDDLSNGETIAVLDARLDSEGRFLSLPIISLAEQGGYKIAPGQPVRLTSTYDNPTGRVLRNAAMGDMYGAFLPDNEEALPSGKSIGP
jgi:hypothetical protein